MLDIRAIFIRDILPLQGVERLVVARVVAGSPTRAVQLAQVRSVSVDRVDTPFFPLPNGDLIIPLPSGAFFEAGQLLSLDVPGVQLDVVAVRTDPVTGTDLAERIAADQMQLDGSTVRLTGRDFSKLAEIRLNGSVVPHAVLDGRTVVCAVPDRTQSIDRIEAVSTSSRVTGTSSFLYMLGGTMQTVSGVDKLLGQFIKVLLTSVGSDAENPGMGGDLQRWAGQTTDQVGTMGAARLVAAIQRAASAMSVAQLRAGLPADETLAAVEILNIATSPSDPSLVELSLAIRTISGKIAAINMLVEGVARAAQNMSGVS